MKHFILIVLLVAVLHLSLAQPRERSGRFPDLPEDMERPLETHKHHRDENSEGKGPHPGRHGHQGGRRRRGGIDIEKVAEQLKLDETEKAKLSEDNIPQYTSGRKPHNLSFAERLQGMDDISHILPTEESEKIYEEISSYNKKLYSGQVPNDKRNKREKREDYERKRAEQRKQDKMNVKEMGMEYNIRADKEKRREKRPPQCENAVNKKECMQQLQFQMNFGGDQAINSVDMDEVNKRDIKIYNDIYTTVHKTGKGRGTDIGKQAFAEWMQFKELNRENEMNAKPMKGQFQEEEIDDGWVEFETRERRHHDREQRHKRHDRGEKKRKVQNREMPVHK